MERLKSVLFVIAVLVVLRIWLRHRKIDAECFVLITDNYQDAVGAIHRLHPQATIIVVADRPVRGAKYWHNVSQVSPETFPSLTATQCVSHNRVSLISGILASTIDVSGSFVSDNGKVISIDCRRGNGSFGAARIDSGAFIVDNEWLKGISSTEFKFLSDRNTNERCNIRLRSDIFPLLDVEIESRTTQLVQTNTQSGRNAVAIGVPTTTRNIASISEYSLTAAFFPSLFKTIDPTFVYTVYVAYDEDDPFYTDVSMFENIKKSVDPPTNVSVKFVAMPSTGIVTFYWNYLFHLSIKEGHRYFYQVNDDLRFLTSNWTAKFVGFLKNNNGIGVTGPNDVKWNCSLLTQAFVSAEHYAMFGWLFPPVLHNWYSDSWITFAYAGLKRCYTEVQVYNSNRQGTRYSPCPDPGWWDLVQKSRAIINAK